MRSADGMSYVARGAGSPVVLLHGWCLDGTMWEYEEQLLVERHRVIVPDLPGFGQSAGMAEPYDLAAHAGAVRTLLEELDLRDALLVGFAFGADVALGVAAEDGSRLRGVVAIGVTSASTFPADRMSRAMLRDWPEFARRSAAVLCARGHSDATRDRLERIYGSTPLRSALAGARLLGEFEPTVICGSVPVPVCYVHGRQDDVIPLAVAEECHRLTATSRLTVIEDSGHLVVLDQREQLHAAIAEFAVELDASGR